MTTIVRVDPTEPAIALTWMISTRCNYDCMYCPADWHDDSSDHPDLVTLQQVWDNFYAKTSSQQQPYKISFTGGEVTANRNFIPLIKYIRKGNFNIKQVVVTTNGSASKKYYAQLVQWVDAISFSTHSEFFNEQDFFSKVEHINGLMPRPSKSLHVNIMDEPWNKNRISLYQDWCQQRNISYSVNAINFSRQIRTEPVHKGVENLVA